MKEDNVVMSKAEEFAIRICNLYSYLSENKKETIISKQIMRSGTSIGANIAEAIFAESPSDFVHKLRIARKEANETKYWLRLLSRSNKLTESEFESLHNDCDGLLRMLSKIILTCDAKQGVNE
ncbi:MAG: four helix bundle protein [Bacteroidales bacterium]|nr:four helix bundle protein [Bacteroidales bacterium]